MQIQDFFIENLLEIMRLFVRAFSGHFPVIWVFGFFVASVLQVKRPKWQNWDAVVWFCEELEETERQFNAAT